MHVRLHSDVRLPPMPPRLLLLALVLLAAFAPSRPAGAQAALLPHVRADEVAREEGAPLLAGWAYRGADGAWAPARTTLPAGDSLARVWPGAGWFRLRFTADPALAGQPLLLGVGQAGAMDAFLDGRLVYRQRTRAPGYRNFALVVLDRRPVHTLLVRYRIADPGPFWQSGYDPGFSLTLRQPEPRIQRSISNLRLTTGIQMFFTALALAFSLVHLMLFAYRPSERSNLYFALFTFCFAVSTYLDYQNLMAPDTRTALMNIRVHRAVVAFPILFGLLSVYTGQGRRIPRRFWPLAAMMAVLGAVAVRHPGPGIVYLSIGTLLLFAEMARVYIVRFRRREPGAWLLMIGFVLLLVFSSYDALLDIGLMAPIAGITNGYPAGIAGLFITASIVLARDFARSDRRAAEAEFQQRLLAQENARQSAELEAARALQLSMLPRTLPTPPGLLVAAAMHTATEVGGDYYDFRTAPDGTLFVAIGDATGHGTRAGIMVAAVKSLFCALPPDGDLPGFFARCTRALRQMHLGNLFMAMTLMEVRGHTLRICAAGMPPVLIARTDGRVEEVRLRGLPLGAPGNLPHPVATCALEPGDTVLLLSDGLPEQFSPERELLGDERTRAAFAEAAPLAPDAALAHLRATADAWRGTAPQSDDMTFVLLRATS